MILSTPEACAPSFGKEISFASNLFCLLCVTVNLCSADDTTMSAYFPICYACVYEMNLIVDSIGVEEGFDKMFGENAYVEYEAILDAHFKFDGQTRTRKNDELLNYYPIFDLLLIHKDNI
jgi:hypothetical protein